MAAVAVVLLALAVGYRVLEGALESSSVDFPVVDPELGAAGTHPSMLYGRVTLDGGAVYEGRLRWGGREEAFWGDYFNGFKKDNPWSALVPPEKLEESHPLEVFGVRIVDRKRTIDLGRPFMARFGDVARIEGLRGVVRVTLKSGTVFDLDRSNADDLADGLRVWDPAHGVVDIGERRIASVELHSPASPGAPPHRLHGTVHTPQDDFTGFVQWDRQKCLGSDALDGRTAEGAQSLRFDTLRSIARRSRDSVLVTLLDGREIVLGGAREVDHRNRGIRVDDPRYGRVLVSWDAFERLDLDPGPSGPVYGDFPPGLPLTGRVTTRAGRVLAGRLVYDLDESETTETLDAPSAGVNYTIPFGLIASLASPGRGDRGAEHATVTLHSGEALRLEPAGDLGDGNAGLLVFVEGPERPEYVSWSDVRRIDFDRPAATYPPLGEP